MATPESKITHIDDKQVTDNILTDMGLSADNAGRRSHATNRLVADNVEKWMLVVSDMLAMGAAYYVVSILLSNVAIAGALLLMPVWIVTMRAYDLYESKITLSVLDRLPKIISAVTVASMVSIVMAIYITGVGLTPVMMAAFWLPAILAIIFFRLITTMFLAFLRSNGYLLKNTLIVGAGEVGYLIARKITRRPSLGLKLVGLVDKDPKSPEKTRAQKMDIFAEEERLVDLIKELEIDNVIITFSSTSTKRTLEAVRRLCNSSVRILVVPRMFEILASSPIFDSIEGIPLMELNRTNLSSLNLLLKRLIDFSLSSTALLILWLPGLVVASLIRLDSRGPAFFIQSRIGKDGAVIRMYKFRTMDDGAEEMQAQYEQISESEGPLFSLKNDPRITRVGKILRRLSIDEFPQLINVLIGNMSLVGPRPQPVREAEHYEELHRRRLLVKPGITGPWQVTGRNELSFDEMVMLDLNYIQNWSLLLDIKLLLQTIPAVLSRRGAY